MAPILGFINGLFGPEGMVLIVLAILLFYGRNLPSVGRSLGKGISEFKKGLKGLEDEVEGSTGPSGRAEAPPLEPPQPPRRIGPPAPRFDDWTNKEGKPKDEDKPKDGDNSNEQKPRNS